MTLVCWRLFYCLKTPPSLREREGFSIGNRFDGTVLEAPPYASAKALLIGNVFDGPTASVLRRLFAGVFSVAWKPLLRRLCRLTTDSMVRLRVSCDACMLEYFLLSAKTSRLETESMVRYGSPVAWRPLFLRVRRLRQLATYSMDRLGVSCDACLPRLVGRLLPRSLLYSNEWAFCFIQTNGLAERMNWQSMRYWTTLVPIDERSILLLFRSLYVAFCLALCFTQTNGLFSTTAQRHYQDYPLKTLLAPFRFG
jgi:hypothetical protein